MALQPPTPTLYFAYGSNLWQHQMQQRCPTSTLLGLAKLPAYRWFISSTGSANIVEDPEASTFGLLYSLQPADEEVLDRREGVPDRHSRETVVVTLFGEGRTREIQALVYIDRRSVREGQPKKEYVYRMNQGINDALAKSMPEEFVRDVMRKYILETWDRDVEEEARRRVLVSAAWDAKQDGKDQ